MPSSSSVRNSWQSSTKQSECCHKVSSQSTSHSSRVSCCSLTQSLCVCYGQHDTHCYQELFRHPSRPPRFNVLRSLRFSDPSIHFSEHNLIKNINIWKGCDYLALCTVACTNWFWVFNVELIHMCTAVCTRQQTRSIWHENSFLLLFFYFK